MYSPFEKSASAGRVETLEPDARGMYVVEDSALLFGGAFSRSGRDLLIQHEQGGAVRLLDYFSGGAAADVLDGNGAVLRGSLIERLAGPEAPGQYAQAGASALPGPIGQVETLDGPSTVTRADGTRQELQVGMKIFQNDLVETTGIGGVSVIFVDGTIFTLAAGSRMVIDSLIYDPQANDNSAGFNLIEGSFVFIAGQVAKTGGMEVNTPSATMGIRGTTVVVEIATVGGVTTSEITLVEDPDGDRGEVQLFDLSGQLIATLTDTDTKWLITPEIGSAQELPRSVADTATDGQLIAIAFAAFRSAFARVDAGDTFLSLDAPSATQEPLIDSGPDPQSLELDNLDEAPGIDTPAPIEPLPDNGGETDTFDEGLLTPDPFDEEVPVIIVQGVEDASEEEMIAANLFDNGVAPGAVEIVQGPSNGLLSIDGAGEVTYQPNPNTNGDDVVLANVIAPDGTIQQVQLIFRITPVNDAPEAEDTVVTSLEDQIVSGDIAASDVDGDVLTFTVEQGPEHGELILAADGGFAYTPDAEFSGTDSFTVRATDPAGLSALSTVSLDISALNDEPKIIADEEDTTGTLVQGSEQTTVGGQLLVEDPDVEDSQTWSGSETTDAGQFVVNQDGSWTYSVFPGAVQSLAEGETLEEQFTVTVTDSQDASDSRVVRVVIEGANDAPVIETVSGGNEGALLEGGEETRASGQLLASDPDTGDSVVWTGVPNASFGNFNLSETGAWSYDLDNSLADALKEGQVVVERMVATASDTFGATTTQTIEVTLTGTNDVPVLPRSIVLRTSQDESVSGVLTATDPDETGNLVFSLGDSSALKGTVSIAADGMFSYTPDGTFAGVETVQYVVTDSTGEAALGTFDVIVLNDEGSVGDQSASQKLVTEANEDSPAHSVNVSVQSAATSSVNLAVVLDGSGSIGKKNWGTLLDQVDQSLIKLSDQFADSTTDVEVSLITFGTEASSFGPLDLQSPFLSQLTQNLPFPGGLTFWNLALDEAADFFFSEDQNETDSNFLLFVTDGRPSSGAYTESLERLQDPNDPYSVNIQAFGYGERAVLSQLNDFETANFPDGAELPEGAEQPEFFTEPEQLTAALQNTPIFNPAFIGMSVTLFAGENDGETIFNPDPATLALSESSFQLALAEIEGIADRLGAQNRVDIQTQFDLNNDPNTAEINLFSSETIGRADEAQLLSGLDEADLLFGSDFDDDISGAGGGDVILGYGGNDFIDIGGGNDTIRAGAGDDRIRVSDLSGGRDDIDGGDGRDTLILGAGAEINALLASLDLSSIEALDMSNDQSDRLSLSLGLIEELSLDADTDLEALLDEALPESATFLGDEGDVLEATLAVGQTLEMREELTVSDDAGNEFNVYDFKNSEGLVLATIAVDSDVSVETVPVA